MFAKIRFLFIYWLRWILVFELGRLFFLIYNINVAKTFSAGSLLQTFLYGLRMDASMATYLVLLPCLFLLLAIFLPLFASSRLYNIYTGIILFPVMLIIFCDLPVYKAWGNRLDAAALKYLASPSEAMASVSNLPILWIIFFMLLSYLLLFRFFKRFIQKHNSRIRVNENKFVQVIMLLAFGALSIIPLRGGIQLSPINQSSVYFSKNNFLNLAAINVSWNFMHSLSQHVESSENPYTFLNNIVASAIKDSLFLKGGQTELIIDPLKNPSPNIIIIVWESFTDKATHISREGIEVTPGFNRLKKEGIYFSDIYCSGDRTDKGIVAVLSGYPAQPITSIIKIPQKAAKLPTLPKMFLDKKYHTSFYYGGELEFANMKSYLLGSGFQDFTSKDDFEKKDQNSKWGAHDNIVKDRILADFKQVKTPFFTSWLTLSSHEPFETPVNTVIKGNDDESLFLNSLHYSDSTITEFIQQCSLQPWWDNTIVIITADHGHRLPQTGRQIDDFKIPLLWLGGALTKKGIVNDKTGSQIDIAATLLGQTGFTQNPFVWSKNLLQPGTKSWAYFSISNAFGFVQPDQYFIYDNVGKMIIEKKGNVTEVDINKGKAIEQMSFEDYLLK